MKYRCASPPSPFESRKYERIRKLLKETSFVLFHTHCHAKSGPVGISMHDSVMPS